MEFKKEGKFYQSDGEHGDTTVILCTESAAPHEQDFSGVVVTAGNNSHIGQYSTYWQQHIFKNELINTLTHEPMSKSEDIEIITIQRKLMDMGYQWKEHVFNDDELGNCRLILTHSSILSNY